MDADLETKLHLWDAWCERRRVLGRKRIEAGHVEHANDFATVDIASEAEAEDIDAEIYRNVLGPMQRERAG